MERYGDFRPTEFDAAGAFLEDRQDWLVLPVSQTRDSGPMTQSNFAAALALLRAADPEGGDHEVHRFGHWGPGWFEILIARPDTACAAVGASIEERLADYPILDEDDCSRRELEAAEETWTQCYSVKERVELIHEHNARHSRYPISVFAARHDCIPQGDSGYIFDRCRPEE